MAYKQAIVIRNDLKLPKGKMTAQGAHASVEAVLRSDKDKVKRWRDEGQMKIVLKADSEKDIYSLNQDAKDSGIKTAIITDAGRTVIAPGTLTALAIGPEEEDLVDSVIKELRLM